VAWERGRRHNGLLVGPSVCRARYFGCSWLVETNGGHKRIAPRRLFIEFLASSLIVLWGDSSMLNSAWAGVHDQGLMPEFNGSVVIAVGFIDMSQ